MRHYAQMADPRASMSGQNSGRLRISRISFQQKMGTPVPGRGGRMAELGLWQRFRPGSDAQNVTSKLFIARRKPEFLTAVE